MAVQVTPAPAVEEHYETATGGAHHHSEVDWETIERSATFRRLVAGRRRFVVPATVFFLTWYFGFVALCGYAPGFMGESVHRGLTVGYVLALTQFLMVWVLGLWYLRYSARELDPLREQTIAEARA